MINLNKLSERERRHLIAVNLSLREFHSYCVVIDPRYQLEWFHRKIAEKLQEASERVERGEDVRLMIFMPPRHGKSDTATQKFPSWVLGKHPEWPFIVASYSQDLATDFGQGTRDLMDSNNYKAIFKTRLREDTKAKAKWMTDQGGGYTAVGVGGAITGRGFKIGIIDDPFKNREEADSPVTRESVYKWWRSTFYTRQEGNTAIVLILTRWHDDDLAGRILREEEEAIKAGETDYDKWEVLEFKAIAEKDEEFRKNGDALWPAKFALPKLMRTKASIGSYEWSALYQQNPVDEEHQELRRDWIQYRTMEEVERMVTRKFATIDPAGSKKKESDFTGVTRNWVNDLNEWNVKSRRYRINAKQIIDLIFELHTEGFETIGIEQGTYLEAIEPFLKVQMQERGIYPNVVPLKHGGIMKETRIRGLIPRYENKKVFHIENSCVDLEEEYLRFPKSAHDDCLDTVAYQTQIALPPSATIGDRISEDVLEAALSNKVNMREGEIIIGLSSASPSHYVIGNSQGVFFNGVNDGQDVYERVGKFLKEWDKAYLFTDQIGESLGLKKLQDLYGSRIFVCWMNQDGKTQQSVKTGNSENWTDVRIARNATIQLIIDELKGERLVLNGSRADWQAFITDWSSLFRTWETDAAGNKVFNWESSSPQGFVKSMIFWRVGLDRFANSQATIIGDDLFSDVKTGRIFAD